MNFRQKLIISSLITLHAKLTFPIFLFLSNFQSLRFARVDLSDKYAQDVKLRYCDMLIIIQYSHYSTFRFIICNLGRFNVIESFLVYSKERNRAIFNRHRIPRLNNGSFFFHHGSYSVIPLS